jgi:hypothetical protein
MSGAYDCLREARACDRLCPGDDKCFNKCMLERCPHLLLFPMILWL